LENIANDIDNYVKNSKNFRTLKTIDPIPEINKLLGINSTNNIDIGKSLLNNLSNTTYFQKNYTHIGKNTEIFEKKNIKDTKSSSNLLDIDINEKFNLKTNCFPSPEKIEIIREETNSDFLMTGIKFLNNKDINEQNKAKFLPPLTKKNSFLINKDLFSNDNNDYDLIPEDNLKGNRKGISLFFILRKKYWIWLK